MECKTCRHWHRNAVDPHNLAAPVQGQCRGAPPVPVGVPTAQGLQVVVMYPTVPGEFPACGAHERPASVIEE